jgi:hypothetical protein
MPFAADTRTLRPRLGCQKEPGIAVCDIARTISVPKAVGKISKSSGYRNNSRHDGTSQFVLMVNPVSAKGEGVGNE